MFRKDGENNFLSYENVSLLCCIHVVAQSECIRNVSLIGDMFVEKSCVNLYINSFT